MYKDKNKKRDKERERQRRYRASKGVTRRDGAKGVTNEAVTSVLKPEVKSVNTKAPSESDLHPAIIAGINRLTTNSDGTVNEQARANRMAAARAYQRMYPEQSYKGVGIAPMPGSPEPVTVSLPGDADYKPLCQFTRDWQEIRENR